MKLFVLFCALLCALALLPAAAGAEEDYTVDLSRFAKGVPDTRTAVHDPSIIACGGVYYIFGSHMAAARSEDLRVWKSIADGYSPSNPVWGDLFGKDSRVFDYAGSARSLIPTDDGRYHVWAPDVIWNDTAGKYFMYYCTSSTWNASNLCYAVSDKVTGPYEWQGALIYSGFGKNTLQGTDVIGAAGEERARKTYMNSSGTYNYNDWPNALDPAVFFDADHRLWMVYGSWSGGIFLLELDPATGRVIHPGADPERGVDPYFGRRLMGGWHRSIEGPYILWDEEAGYYYLFVSYGSLTSNGGYQIRVFRSETPDGDYTDMNGKTPSFKGSHAGYGLKLSGNYLLPSLSVAYMATGHNSAMIDADGRRYVCCHTRFDDGTERHAPMVKQYFLNREGWPCLLPYAVRDRDVSLEEFGAEDAAGRWYAVRQGTDISSAIAQPFVLYFRPDGTVGGEKGTGSYAVEEGSAYLTVDWDGREYSGVLCRMTDEAGTPVTVFSAVGGNESLWGVRYAE